MRPPPACGVCGAPCKPPFRAPAAELAPDLDGRPGEPARSTLPRWIATCRSCGAAAPELALLPRIAGEVVRSDAYKQLRSPFLRWAAICEREGERGEAAEAVLQAAWAADDAGEDAAPLRRRSAALWDGDPLRRIDVLRRAGELAQAAALAESLPPTDEQTAAILAFQRDRIAAGDTGRHMISSALRPPSRTPHASTLQANRAQPSGGFWARLFGR